MKIQWTSKSLQDLERLYAHLRFVAPEAAERVIQQLTRAPNHLLEHPKLGEKLEGFEPREIRRIIVGHYEIRYELTTGSINVLRIWHGREERSRESDN